MYLVIKVKGFNRKSRPYARSYGCYKQRDEDSKNESRGNAGNHMHCNRNERHLISRPNTMSRETVSLKRGNSEVTCQTEMQRVGGAWRQGKNERTGHPGGRGPYKAVRYV